MTKGRRYLPAALLFAGKLVATDVHLLTLTVLLVPTIPLEL
jgi:hypothetical protein